MSLPKLIVVAPTFYTSLDEPRYRLGLRACQEAAKHRIRLILVDASPLDEIRTGLEEAGTDKGQSYVRVVLQTAKGKKGAALREAIQVAHQEQSTTDEFRVIAFQELEKVDMFRHWHALVQHMVDEGMDVTVPRREDSLFRDSYPIEQHHCESFANQYLDSLGAEIGLVPIDWTVGPIAFRWEFTKHWLDFGGELWDAQLVPLVQAHAAGAKVSSFEVEYKHPEEMKLQEQGVAKWNEKRLYQLNYLKETVGQALLDQAAGK